MSSSVSSGTSGNVNYFDGIPETADGKLDATAAYWQLQQELSKIDPNKPTNSTSQNNTSSTSNNNTTNNSTIDATSSTSLSSAARAANYGGYI